MADVSPVLANLYAASFTDVGITTSSVVVGIAEAILVFAFIAISPKSLKTPQTELSAVSELYTMLALRYSFSVS